MGKCVNKSKAKEGAPAIEMNHAKTPLGVRTRSMTLELKRLQKLPASPSAASAAIEDGGSYLQLRSRQVERLSLIAATAKTRKQFKKGLTSKIQGIGLSSENQESEKDKGNEPMLEENENEEKNNSPDDLKAMESSWGQNNLEFASAETERATRETTPVHLIRDPDILVPIPPRPRTRHRFISTIIRAKPEEFFAPPRDEVNEFFGDDEEKQKNKFTKKYNFDTEKDEPLPGRYEWEKLKP